MLLKCVMKEVFVVQQNKYEKRCKWCDLSFVADTHMQKYCSYDCKRAAYLEQQAQFRNRQKNKGIVIKYKENVKSIDEILEELKIVNEERYKNGKSHLSYGQYILKLKDKEKEG